MGGSSITWDADPHTLAKHRVYECYLGKWMPIMIQGWKGNITYAEGFAGPGIYNGGEPGSPVLALRTLIGNPSLRMRARDLRFLFVEKDKGRAEQLRKELAKEAKPVALSELHRYGIDLEVASGSYDPNLVNLLTEHKAWGRPMLVVLDTFGGAVKLDLVRRIARNPSSEVIITFEPQTFSRFASADGVEHGDTVFGDPSWRDVATQPPEAKTRWVVAKYRDVLVNAGFPYVLTFELVTNRGHSLFLVFGTTHVRGLQKMKEAMWEIDPISGVRYRDPADPSQELLDIELEPATAPLKRELLVHLRGLPGNEASVSDLRRFALYRTVYKESQVRPVLDQLATLGQIIGDGPECAVRLGGSVRLVGVSTNKGGG